MTRTSIKRLHIHFPGFEPLNAGQHYKRYAVGCTNASNLWDTQFNITPFDASNASFSIASDGGGWSCVTDCILMDYSSFIVDRLQGGFLARQAAGFRAFFQVIAMGGLTAYFRHAWRFALFFLFPFLFTLLGMVAVIGVAFVPPMTFGKEHTLWSVLLALLASYLIFKGLFERFFIGLLMRDWAFAVAMAKNDNPEYSARIESFSHIISDALHKDYDEVVITGHSIGGVMAVHSFGHMLERHPDLTQDKRITFVQLGGAFLQSALLSPAIDLRRRASRIAADANVYWIEVQCLTDVMNFYKTNPLQIIAAPFQNEHFALFRIRVRALLSAVAYKRIRRDFLRVHRQFVLSADRKAAYDFIPLIAGPQDPCSFLKRPNESKL